MQANTVSNRGEGPPFLKRNNIIQKPILKQSTARIPAAITQQRPRVPTDIAMDTIFENERGSISFSKKALLPTDSPAFCDLKGSFSVDVKFYQCPPNWVWVSDWILDMNGPVDEQGWSYNDSFLGSADSWTNSAVGRRVSIVRRRKWTRMRRAKGDANVPSNLDQVKDTENIITIIQRKNIDRERLQAIKHYLADKAVAISDPVGAILDEFDYECSKLDACLLLSKVAASDPKIIKQCLSNLSYFSDKIVFLKAAGKRFEELPVLL